MSKQVIATLVLIPFLLFYGLFFSCVQAAGEKEERSWQDEAIYFMMVDRFNNGDSKNDKDVNTTDLQAYNGGDLKGITKRLDYIQDMGFTSILLTPVVDNEEDGYHGYWTKDFYKVEEHFGSMADMKELVKEAHKRDMKVILDFVAGYTGSKNPWLFDKQKQGWYQQEQGENEQIQIIEESPLAGLPHLNFENEEVRKFLINNAKWWVQQTDIDGFRLEDMQSVPKDFWGAFVRGVKAVKQDFFFIGDVSTVDASSVAEYQNMGIDSFLNISSYKNMTKVFSQTGQSPNELYKDWKSDQVVYPNPYLLGNFLDNQNTKRFTRVALEEKQYPPTRLRLALAYLFTSPGIPIMYYGTEIALDGGDPPDNRRLMDFKTDADFLKYISKLGELRKQLPSLRRGTFEMVYDKGGMSVFKRTYQEETTIIALNNTKKTQKVHLTREQLDTNKELHGLMEEDIIRPAKDGYYLVLDRETANVYALAEKTGLNIPFISVLVGINVLFVIFLILVRRRRKKS